jgi:hypothetical protein
MAFHDLTPNQSAPPAAKSLLGLGSKFIPVPSRTTAQLHTSFDRLERDFNLRVYLAQDVDESIGDLVDLDRSKLRVKSKWKPSAGDVPNWCAQRLSRFFVQVQRLFKQQKAQPNLLPHQEELLQTLPVDPNFLFPETDKGLGPCAVTHEQYTTVEHLTNKDVYEQLSETEALAAATALNSDIQAWLRTYKNVIGDQAHGFILNASRTTPTAHLASSTSSTKFIKARRMDAGPPAPFALMLAVSHTASVSGLLNN